MKLKFVVTFFMITVCLHLSAQVTTFQRYYDTLDSYLGNCVQETFEGGFVFCGSAFDGFGSQDAVIFKTDSNGEVTWVKDFGGPGSQGATHIEQLPDSSFIVLAFQDGGSLSEKVWLLKLSYEGDTIWAKVFSLGNNGTICSRLAKCFDNGYAITGYYNVNGSGNYDAFLLKVDENGIYQWSNTYGGPYSENPFDIKQTSDSGFILVGGGPDFSSNADVLIIRTNSMGDSLWSKNYGFSNADFANSVQQTADNGFIVIGTSWNLTGNNYDLYLIKTDEQGDTMWTKFIGDNYENSGISIQISPDGGYFVEGTTATPTNNYDFCVVKTDSLGNVQWSKTYGSTSSEILFYATQCKDGGLALVGRRETDNLSICFVKTDGQGSVIGVSEIVINAFVPIQFFPNPLSTRSTIVISEEIDLTEMQVYMYDNFGKLLENRKVFDYNFEISRNNHSAGLYFLVFSNQVYHQTIKFIIK